MIKIIIGVFITLATIIFISITFYWRDTFYNPTEKDIIQYFLGLPVVLTFSILSPYFIYKIMQKHKKSQLENQDEVANRQAIQVTEKKENRVPKNSQAFKLNIYSSTAWHNFGENEEIIEKSKQFKSPELDTHLCNTYGLPILSFRIQKLDELLATGDEEDIRFTIREKRIKQLITHQIEQHSEVLFQVANHLKQSAMHYDSELAYQYRMHPAWLDLNQNNNETIKEELPIVDFVPRLNQLNLYILLPEHLIHQWNESTREKILDQFVENYSILPLQISIEYYFINQEQAYTTWLNLLEEISKKSYEFNLIISADSEIDQEWVDEKNWQSEAYIAAEFTSSWCIANNSTEVIDLTPQQTVNINIDEPHATQFLQKNKLNQLAQFEQEDPFLFILDDITDIKKSKKVQQIFTEIKIEPHHFLYLKQNFGHTQQVAKIFTFMLGAHLPNDLMAMVYSTDQDSVYVYFEQYLAENINKNLMN